MKTTAKCVIDIRIILEMLERKQYKELKEELENNMYPVDLADILEEFDQKHLVMVFPASCKRRGCRNLHVYEQRHA